jgi:hypothetical protein
MNAETDNEGAFAWANVAESPASDALSWDALQRAVDLERDALGGDRED